ncbi:MAG: DUF853 family protein [Clostridia bacterium]|nr:DUF853 family protein [Clostridia bacterium]
MLRNGRILVGAGGNEAYLEPNMANRHGLIAGATGTGKTVTLKVLAESFSALGVPVFLADIKGDLAGCCMPGTPSEKISERLTKLGIPAEEFGFTAFPVRFFDVYGTAGHPIRTTVSDMGSELLSRLLGLTEIQSGVLAIAFRVADDNGWLLEDLKDLRAMLSYVTEHASELLAKYGNVSKQSAGAIQRALLRLEDAGATAFFGAPAIDLADWMQCDEDGRGVINILHAEKLYQSPLLYSTFLLWLLSELFETLPEAGDLDKPKLVFFFDEAHLLFRDAPKALVAKIEQVVKLIRSKGVGVYFISQQPSDIPDNVLSQLGNRVQHALRAYTPSEQRALRTAARSFRVNPAFDTEEAISALGTGEALVSFLDAKGIPGIVERATILPPQSRMGTITEEERRGVIEASPLFGKYEAYVDNESAYEILTAESAKEAETAEKEKAEAERAKQEEAARKAAEKKAREEEKAAREQERKKAARAKKNPVTKVVNSAVTSIGREVGRSLARGLLGSLKKLF